MCCSCAAASPRPGESPGCPNARWSAPRHALGCPCALGCFRLAASLLYFAVRCVYVAKSSRRAAAARQQPKGLSAPDSPTPPPRPSERREDSTARPRYDKRQKSPAGDSRGAHDMTLLDHSRAQERDAVAKTRPTTDSDTVVVRAAGSLGVFIGSRRRRTAWTGSGRVAAGGRGGRRRPSRQHQHAGPGAVYVRPDCDGTRHRRRAPRGCRVGRTRPHLHATRVAFRGLLRAVADRPCFAVVYGDGLPLFHRGSHSFHHE